MKFFESHQDFTLPLALGVGPSHWKAIWSFLLLNTNVNFSWGLLHFLLEMFLLAAFSELNARRISDAILHPRFCTLSQSEGFSSNLQEFLLGGCCPITRVLIFFLWAFSDRWRLMLSSRPFAVTIRSSAQSHCDKCSNSGQQRNPFG